MKKEIKTTYKDLKKSILDLAKYEYKNNKHDDYYMELLENYSFNYFNFTQWIHNDDYELFLLNKIKKELINNNKEIEKYIINIFMYDIYNNYY